MRIEHEPGTESSPRKRHPHIPGRITGSAVRWWWAGGVILGLRSACETIGHIPLPIGCGRDFLRDYLLARAIVHRTDLYQPLSALAATVGQTSSDIDGRISPHRSPHPPTAAILFLSLAALDYLTAEWVWLFLELVFLMVTVRLPAAALGDGPNWKVDYTDREFVLFDR